MQKKKKRGGIPIPDLGILYRFTGGALVILSMILAIALRRESEINGAVMITMVLLFAVFMIARSVTIKQDRKKDALFTGIVMISLIVLYAQYLGYHLNPYGGKGWLLLTLYLAAEIFYHLRSKNDEEGLDEVFTSPFLWASFAGAILCSIAVLQIIKYWGTSYVFLVLTLWFCCMYLVRHARAGFNDRDRLGLLVIGIAAVANFICFGWNKPMVWLWDVFLAAILIFIFVRFFMHKIGVVIFRLDSQDAVRKKARELFREIETVLMTKRPARWDDIWKYADYAEKFEFRMHKEVVYAAALRAPLTPLATFNLKKNKLTWAPGKIDIAMEILGKAYSANPSRTTKAKIQELFINFEETYQEHAEYPLLMKKLKANITIDALLTE